jgi:drug/metabolite transporter (DMT)-like permease
MGGFLTKRMPALLVVAISQVAGFVIIGLIALASGAWRTQPGDYVGWAIVAGWSGAAGMLLFYRALASGAMGVVAPISSLSGLVPLIAGLAAGERFTTMSAVGAIAIGAGVLLASGPEMRAEAGWRPLVLAVLAAVLFGITLLAIARGSQSSAVMTLTGMRIAQISLFAPLAYLLWLRLGSSRPTLRPVLPMIALIGVLDVGANLAYGLSAELGPLVVVAVLGSLYPVVTAVLAAAVLGERLRTVQYVGVAGAVSGLMLMTAG